MPPAPDVISFRPKRSVGSQAVALALSAGVAQAFVAVMYVVAARVSTPREFGAAVTAIAIGYTMFGLLDFGGNALWVRELVRGDMSRDALGSFVTWKSVCGIVVGGALSLIAAMWWPGHMVWGVALTAFSMFVAQSAQVPLRTLGRGELVSLAVIVDKFVSLAVFLALAGVQDTASALIIALGVGSVADAVLSARLTPRRSRMRFGLRSGNPFKDSLHYGVASLGISAQSLDLPLMSLVSSVSAAGVYGAVNRWTQPMGILANAFARASSPYAARARSFAEAVSLTRRGLWLPGAACLGCLAMVFAGPWAVSLLLGERYASSGPVVQLLALGTIPAIGNQIMAVVLQALGSDRVVSRVLVATVLVQLGLVALLARPYGATGAASAFLMTQLLMFTAFIVVVTRIKAAEM